MAELAAPALADGPIRFLPNLILEPRRPLLTILIGWVLAAIPALLLAAAVQAVFPEAESPDFAVGGWLAVFLLAVFSPVVESLIMGAALVVLQKWLPAWVSILISAVGWGIMHALAAPAWGLVIWWPFLIFSTIFTVWRTRGFWAGVGMASAVHGLNNLIPALMIAYAPTLQAT